MNIHKKIVHDIIRDFKCDHCEYSDIRKNHLNVHKKQVHYNMKGQKCSKCDYAASKRSDMKRNKN